MLNSLLTFIRVSGDGSRTGTVSSMRSVREKQLEHDSRANLNQY